MGFYYVWDWGSLGGKNEQWLAARAAWARVVRVLLERKLPEVDSPLQVEQYVQAKGTRSQKEELELWLAIADTVSPPVATRWVSHDVIDHVLDRLDVLEAERGPVLVWCESIALLDALEECGMAVLRPGAPVPKKPRTVALSRSSFGTGRNLQAWNTNLVPEVSSSGKVWEQCLDEKTEILTRLGWVGIDDPWPEGEDVAAYSVEDGTVAWSFGKRVERLLGKEEMFGLSNPHLDIRVTAGHRMVCQRAKTASCTARGSSCRRPRCPQRSGFLWRGISWARRLR